MTISIDPQKTNNESLQPKGWLRYFSFSLDHKVIGIQYLVCGFLFYLKASKQDRNAKIGHISGVYSCISWAKKET